jgi:hypothetical protein
MTTRTLARKLRRLENLFKRRRGWNDPTASFPLVALPSLEEFRVLPLDDQCGDGPTRTYAPFSLALAPSSPTTTKLHDRLGMLKRMMATHKQPICKAFRSLNINRF